MSKFNNRLTAALKNIVVEATIDNIHLDVDIPLLHDMIIDAAYEVGPLDALVATVKRVSALTYDKLRLLLAEYRSLAGSNRSSGIIHNIDDVLELVKLHRDFVNYIDFEDAVDNLSLYTSGSLFEGTTDVRKALARYAEKSHHGNNKILDIVHNMIVTIDQMLAIYGSMLTVVQSLRPLFPTTKLNGV